MSSFDKIVKMACKPKAAPPKAKYLDPIVMATYSEDGSVGDIFKALAPKLREPSAIIVFKALIVLHTMMRNGSTDNVLSYLSQESDILKLRNVAQGQWEGYDAPENLIRYAAYLETRIRAYRDLKHDAIRVQSESNRDAHLSGEVNGGSTKKKGGTTSNGPQRSKTMMGRKLRSMSVEKGLLRETKIVQKQMDTLLACKFYLDDLEDGELTITALRLLVKDLLVLFQAVNEGVINVLGPCVGLSEEVNYRIFDKEHYFEMSHVDAEESLKIYRHFCKQAEAVVEYLSVAKKMQNLLNVPIPNLKHAPVSLAGALEEYLNDPNFEQNRLEYKQNKDIADGKAPAKPVQTKKEQPKSAAASNTTTSAAAGPSQAPPSAGNKELVDFFASIELGQQDMFNPHTNSPNSMYFNQQATANPFVARQSMLMPQATAAFPGAGAFPGTMPFVQAQATGFPNQFGGAMPNAFLQPIQTGVPSTFPQIQPQAQPNLLQPQPGLLQPQPTGNPFRQSMLLSQSTGMPNMGTASFGLAPQNAPHTAPMRSMSAFEAPMGQPSGPSSTQPSAFQPTPFGAQPQTTPQRSASTPLTNHPDRPAAAPLMPMKTGSRNPFAPSTEISAPAPPPPPQPTLNALRTGAPWIMPSHKLPNGGLPPLSESPLLEEPPKPNGTGPAATSSIMSSIASSFTKPEDQNKNQFTSSLFGGSSNFSSSAPFSTAGKSNETGPTPFPGTGQTSTPFSLGGGGQDSKPSANPLTVQPTGFGGSSVKPFQPTSSFGASLMASLPPIGSPTNTTASPPPTASTASTSTGTPNASAFSGPSFGASTFSGMSSQGTGVSSAPTGFSSFSGLSSSTATTQPSQSGHSGAPSSSFGQSLGTSGGAFGTSLMPQSTGVPNPFRASVFNPSGPASSPFSAAGSSAFGTGAPAFGSQPFGQSGPPGGSTSPFGQQPFGQQNQNQSTAFGSLI
ncbi:ANTH-domain-containing protein [Calocera viscosa TUFC12733]|uniref:ANTH-domain-containing protein n=1 Tax=Calocera viscosa (strain TUFC12733) TaxID=1330018 RepID=A0A167SAH6_CALVF|nr:ANTH-domain-containing protein [Calocera viscosa TUFC12733]